METTMAVYTNPCNLIVEEKDPVTKVRDDRESHHIPYSKKPHQTVAWIVRFNNTPQLHTNNTHSSSSILIFCNLRN